MTLAVAAPAFLLGSYVTAGPTPAAFRNFLESTRASLERTLNIKCQVELFRPTLELLSLCAELLAHLYPSLGIPLDSTKHAITLFVLALTRAASTIVTFLTPPFYLSLIHI